MKTVKLTQGSPEWHAHRRIHRNASDAPAMMGLGLVTRSQLLHEAFTGLEREVSDFVADNIFAPGHEFEVLARPLAQEFLGKKLYPVVAVREVGGIKLSASYDGVDMMETIGFEHKRLNNALREIMCDDCTGADLPLMYQIQMEQQCIVGEIDEVLFMASEWNGEDLIEERHCIYKSNPELAAAIVAGWIQFEADLSVYAPPEVVVKAEGRTPDNLPALRIELTGQVTTSNLAQYKEHALAVFESINRELKTDQDFADAEKTVKWCADIEDRLAAAKQHALSQTQSIDQLFSTIDEISAEARRVRLDLDKLVKAQKESIRNDIVLSRTASLKAHIADLNASIGKPLMPVINADIAGAMKGKRTVDTLRDAADTELARAKIEATGVADRIKANLATLSEHGDKSALFPDLQSLALKSPEDLASTITARIATHEANEAARKAREAQVQAEREAEEAARQARQAAASAAVTSVAAAPAKDLLDDNVVDAEIPVTTMQRRVQADSDVMLKLGDINARIAPLTVTADGLKSLGFEPASIDKSAKLYRERDFHAICTEIIRVVTQAQRAARGL